MARAIILVMDSFGIGTAPDAHSFGDSGANTLGHIAEEMGGLNLPNLSQLGLGEAARLVSGHVPKGLQTKADITGAFGAAAEVSSGKDTPSGHWEIAGLPVTFDWGYFPKTEPCFPADFIDALTREAKIPGILGNKHASGTEIIAELGLEHLSTGKPLCYTSADSVFQIAAHEEVFGLQRLFDLCAVAKRLLEPLKIGRVIARPFIGDAPETFKRTENRRDFSVPPHGATLLDHVQEAGGSVISVGKISDIFAGVGITHTVKAKDNHGLFDKTLEMLKSAQSGDLVFTNFVDFDMLFGHRRDVNGYAQALEAFDLRLPELRACLQEGDIVLITADHGCDPTWPGTDHTREYVPVLFFGPGVKAGSIGLRDSFADMGQTIANHLALDPLKFGTPCDV